ncbi:ribonuclease P protein component [Gloeobacter kilaueensis]|uniref:Ribonuclease P protein component n=1 Tax=Gloeobacter kilaueensis (strain ATCC BAA-2537 / CCAP 1431/1 / ULC 316 / JS1) TaxID=1183438 RepID=U5QPC2_GLOK1|nr:ribonuclease P protein component [Gloeobacter kilaueensis]AGY60753.1 ribonuclease P protein component [Gloeobacter kilaueensis JS1]
MLPKCHRLRRHRDFEQVHRRGRRHSTARLHLLILRDDGGASRIGITTSRKVGNAVRRNRWRRLIRESLREVLPKIAPGYKIVVVVRSQPQEAEVPAYLEVRAEVHSLLLTSGVLAEGSTGA